MTSAPAAAPPARAVAERAVDVVVVGAGPAGLSTATELAGLGAGRIAVLDRDVRPGGIPRLCHHTGFGLRDLRRSLTGPAYAERLVERAVAAGVEVRAGVSVTGWGGPLALDAVSADGLERITASAVVLATGARERPRSARWIPGDRPEGVLTTGQLQRAVYEQGLPVGRRAVVVGAEHVSFSAVVTLAHAGVRVVAMVTPWGRHQSYEAFRLASLLRYRFLLRTGTRVARIIGRGRVEAVEVVDASGTTEVLACDTVVLTGDWVAEHELVRTGGMRVDPAGTGALADTGLRADRPGVVVAGNLVHPVLTADGAALDAAVAARSVRDLMDGVDAGAGSVPLVVGDPLRWVAPGRVGADRTLPPRGRLVLWACERRSRPTIEVRQGGRLLERTRSLLPLVPERPFELGARWVEQVQVPGPEVAVTVH